MVGLRSATFFLCLTSKICSLTSRLLRSPTLCGVCLALNKFTSYLSKKNLFPLHCFCTKQYFQVSFWFLCCFIVVLSYFLIGASTNYNMHTIIPFATAAAAAKSLQSYPTLCDPIDGSPPGTTVPGIFQARTLEWVAISFSNAWKWKVKVKSFSHVWPFTTPWTAAYQAPLSMGFSRQKYWSGLPLPFPIIPFTLG